MKRLLTSTPSEILDMSGRELLQAIKMSEGRVLRAGARVRGPNLIDGVSNAEVVAAFGADIINLDTYELNNPYIPGWDSKDPNDDFESKKIQVPMGRGYMIREIEEIVGRPISLLMLVANSDLGIERSKQFYGNIIADEETLIKAKEQGVRMIQLDCLAEGVNNNFPKQIKKIRKIIGSDMIIQVSRSHGSGILNIENSKYSLISKDEVKSLIEAGVDIIGFPAPGTYPGWNVAMCKEYVDLAHSMGTPVMLGVHTSQEGSTPKTLEQIALYAKMAGADIHDLGDCGFTESMIDPENIMRYGVAIRGKRHHYRRMAMSNRR